MCRSIKIVAVVILFCLCVVFIQHYVMHTEISESRRRIEELQGQVEGFVGGLGKVEAILLRIEQQGR